MKEIPIHNNGSSTMYVNGRAIPHGETRMFNEHEVPPHLRPTFTPEKKPVTEANPNADLLALLDRTIPQITERLPGLSDEELDIIEAAEQAGKTRAGLLKVIAEERLERAAHSPSALDVADLKIALSTMDEDELLEQLNVFAGDDGRLALVQEEIDLRAAANAGAGEQ